MYTRVQKDSSSVSHSSLQKKSENLVSPRNFSVQPKPDTESLQKQEMPSYSRAAADSLYSNVMRSMEGTGHSQEIGIQRQCSECAQEEKDSDEMPSVAGVQTKLTVGAVGDKYEQEADRVAAQVMSMPAAPNNSPQVQRFGEEDNPVQRWSLAQSITPHVQRQVDEQVQMRELVQRAFQTGGKQASGDLEGRLNASKGGGSALAPEVRAFMEPRFGADFSGVRVHTGSEAVQMNRELGAQAFAHGSDVYFGAGKSPGNNELTAHELTHVVQQTGGVQPKALQRNVLSGIIQRTPTPPSYGSVTGVRDLNRIRIDAVADFLASSLTAPRNVNVHVSDPNVRHITWMLYDPSDQMMSGSYSTIPGQPDSTTRPFTLQPSHFSGTGFVPGKYILRCSGLNASHQPIVYADRDFNVLRSDLTTGTALPTTYGQLTFTEYSKTDANPPTNPRYSVNVKLAFLPKQTVSCNDVAFMQSIRTIDSQGRSQHNTVNSEQDARQTPLAWSIDRVGGAPSPFYIADRDPGNGAVVDNPGWGQAGTGGATPREATLIDRPSWNQENVFQAESCVICRSGANVGQVYGAATWGYTANAAGQVTLMPRSFSQMPSDQFEEARTAWNTWRATLPAANQPQAAPALRSP